MNDTIGLVFVLVAAGALVASTAIPVSAALVRLSARRLPAALALRMEEEWLSELNSINSRPGKLAFAVALILTRRRAFVAHGEETVSETTALGGRKSLLVLCALVFASVAYGASFLIPVRYASEALIVSNQPDSLLPQKITSRRFLEGVVQQMKWQDDMIDDLRRNVTVTTEFLVEAPGAGSAWAVKYLGADPKSAQQITSLILRHFIEEELQHRSDQSIAAQDFMKANLAQLAARVQKKGDELAHSQEPKVRDMIALDHELLVSSYKAWFSKILDSEMTAGLLESNFRILEAPQVGKAITPNRAGFAGLGALAGLIMGGMTMFGLDRRRRRLALIRE